MSDILLYIIGFIYSVLISVLVTWLSIIIAHRLQYLSHPVGRSSHTKPTPQLGGIGICISFVTALMLLPALSDFGTFTLQTQISQLRWSLFVVIVIGFLLGLTDDVLTISPPTKLIGLIILAFTPILFKINFPLVEIAGLSETNLWCWLSPVLLAGWLIFFINGFNFMDGVNGQSAVFALNALIWFSLIILFNEEGYDFPNEMILINILLAGALIGFLPWNFPNAKTFMGDSGALPVGAVLALLAVSNSNDKIVSFIGFLLIFSVYIYDVLFTIARRALRRENIFMAHHSHLYQRMLVATGWSHTRLLFFHLPFYLSTGLASFIYFFISSIYLRTLIVLCVLIMLLFYSFLVVKAEKKVKYVNA